MWTVIRRYFSYEVLDHTEYLASLELTIRIRQQDFILLPVKSYTADLKVTDANNNEMIILPDIEFERKYGVSLSALTQDYISSLNEKIENPDEGVLTEDHRLIAIAMKFTIDFQYEKIKISWKEKLKQPQRQKGFRLIKLPTYIIGYGLGHSSSLYVSISVRHDHLILKNPLIRIVDTNDEPKYTPILDADNEKIYRFSDDSSPQIIEIIIIADLPDSIKHRMIFSVLVGLVAPTYVVMFPVIYNVILRFSHEILISVIGFLLAQRIFVSRNIPLIDDWNKSHISLAVYCGFLLFLIITLEFAGVFHYMDTTPDNKDPKIEKNNERNSILNSISMNETLSITDSLMVTVDSTHILQ